LCDQLDQLAILAQSILNPAGIQLAGGDASGGG
jgi:hypothetical protein